MLKHYARMITLTVLVILLAGCTSAELMAMATSTLT